MTSPATTPAWNTLLALAKSTAEISNSAIDSIEITDSTSALYADFSRHSIDQPRLTALLALAESMQLAKQREALFAGGIVNKTEQRPALHTALRSDSTTPLWVGGVDGVNNEDSVGSVDIRPLIRAQLQKMESFSNAIRSGKRRGISGQIFTDIVNIGIGGSYLGPAFVCTALAGSAEGPRVHFVANIDGANLAQTLATLNPATTLFTVTSKTFTTDETMTNARSAENWLTAYLGADAVAAHFVAITAHPAAARKSGYTDETIFEFWDWVGGRYSLWSAVGLPIALAYGYAQFAELLAGARHMDEHFCHAPLAQNLPVMLALTGVWSRNFLELNSHAVLPYAERLALLPNHLQQVEMESTGKSVDLDGQPVSYATCPVIFGEVGTNGQHSFHQLLHQGSEAISCDILMVAEPQSSLKGHHEKLLANAVAQADALWQGKSQAAAYADLATHNLSATQRNFLAAHRTYPGKRPVTVMVLPKINAFYVGAIAALYEHKVFTQGVIWNIDPFDQWGVELGKMIATSLLPLFNTPSNLTAAPAHLKDLLQHLSSPQATLNES